MQFTLNWYFKVLIFKLWLGFWFFSGSKAVAFCLAQETGKNATRNYVLCNENANEKSVLPFQIFLTNETVQEEAF